MSSHIYHGPWVNWSHGLIKGATVTMSDRNGGLLTSFIATFITLVSVQLWRILCFAIHQIRYNGHPQDGLYHQQQALFRNSSTPGGTAWTFMQQCWFWRNKARMSILRTLPWALFALAYLLVFALAAIFSADISKAPGSARLVIGDTCGYWVSESMQDTPEMTGYRAKMANDTQAAAAYAKQCYGNVSDTIKCSQYPTQQVLWTSNQNATCPFESGICVYGDNAAYQMESKVIDSHFDLGINAPERYRLQYQYRTTCAPLVMQGYYDIVQGEGGSENDTLIQIFLGPLVANNGEVTTNRTTFYNTHGRVTTSDYSLDTSHAFSTWSGGWSPIEALNRTDADVTLVSIAPNGMLFSKPSNDPVFTSGQRPFPMETVTGNSTFYVSDKFVSFMACAEQHRFCNPNNGVCSPYLGLIQLGNWYDGNQEKKGETFLQANTVQTGTARRLIDGATILSMHFAIMPRGGNALRASETASGRFQGPLPDNQWMIELASWFDLGLARFQQKIMSFATGPPFVPEASIWQPKDHDDLVQKAMCYSQIINDTADTVSFSVLGLGILFAVGILIIITNNTIEWIVGWFRTRFSTGQAKQQSWIADDKFQLQRIALEDKGLGRWSGESIPVTLEHEKFVGLGGRDFESHDGGNGGYAAVHTDTSDSLTAETGYKGARASAVEKDSI